MSASRWVRLWLAGGLALGACTTRPEPALSPDMLVDVRSTEVRSPFGMVVAASAEPAEVAVHVLEAGGTAMDAAVAAAFALGVADPAASGLGGAIAASIEANMIRYGNFVGVGDPRRWGVAMAPAL